MSFLTLPSPALRIADIRLLLDAQTEKPLLSPDFLGGYAPVLGQLAVQDVGLSRAAASIPALQNVYHFFTTALTAESLELVPLIFPRLETLHIRDPMVPDPVPPSRARALWALDAIPRIIIELRAAPQWSMHLLPVLPLATIQTLTLITTEDPRGETSPEAFCRLLDVLPGDLDVSIRTADAPKARGGVNLIARAEGGRLVREFALPDLQKLHVPDRVCVRIAELEIHQPDWDRTCLWLYPLMFIRTLRLVFYGRAAFFALLRREKYRRVPVPVSFIDVTQILLYAEDRLPTDVDFGELYRWLRAGTFEPVFRGSQRFQIGGLNLIKADTTKGTIGVEVGSLSAETKDFVEAARVRYAEQLRTEGLYGSFKR